MLTSCAVQTLVLQHQALNRPPADNVRFDNFIHVGQTDSAIPDRLGIDHEVRSVLALVQAAGLVGAHSALQPALGQFLLEQLLQLCPRGGIATSAWMAWRALVSADENMALEFRHMNIVQEWQRIGCGVILISIRGTHDTGRDTHSV